MLNAAPHANWTDTVYHGIDLGALTFNPRGGEYLAFLGRISPDKGVNIAVRVAREAHIPLKIAARKPLPFRNDPEVRRDWEYYQQEIQPLLRGPDVEFIGEVYGAAKDEFLGRATEASPKSSMMAGLAASVGARRSSSRRPRG
jgi:glycosyltransferase involved in cell wall biosynthesis